MKIIHNQLSPSISRRCVDAFSMVEVTLAVAIVGLAMVVIMGLMPSGINASRRVADETMITSLAGDMMHWRRITPYTLSPYVPAGAANLTIHSPTAGSVITNYFDVNGYLPKDEYNNPDPRWSGPYFRFITTVQNQPEFPGDANIAQLVVRVDWPCVNTGTNNPPPPVAANYSTRIFVTQYTRTQ